ncbi:MAG: hypothetical protein LQ340_004808 [Diploschistes diacapsis]|nr:MAG: hypothetical protein LQ340_004808 [Diploschistes diacapsis]
MNGLKYIHGFRTAEPSKPIVPVPADRPHQPTQDLGGGIAPYPVPESEPQAMLLNNVSYFNKDTEKQATMAGQSTTKDPVSMHLLMETAIGDSEHYDVLSQTELDSLKRELVRVSGQLNTSRHQLVLDTKVRDAARSMDRLSAVPTKDVAKPGSRGKGGDAVRDTPEMAQSVKRCEELTEEITHLEKEEYRLQKRLLEHTAGVLQLTHKGYLKKDPSPEDIKNGQFISGMNPDGEFGGLGQYALYEQVLDNELNGDKPTAELAGQHQIILDVERKVEDLNAKLRDMILELKPRKLALPLPPPQLDDDPDHLAEVLFEQVDFLEKCLRTVHDLQNATARAAESEAEREGQLILGVEKRMEDLNVILRDIILGMKPRKDDLPNPARELRDDPTHAEDILLEQLDFLEACLKSLQRLVGRKLEAGEFDTSEDRIEALNNVLFDLMAQNDPERASKYFPPPKSDGTTILDQFIYLQQGLKAVDRRMGELGDFEDTAAEKLASYQNRAEQYASVIGGLWDILTAEDHEAALRSGLPPPQDNFSLQAFSAKVQELHATHLDLLDQKAVLTRQIQQQRELGATADSTRDQRMDSMREENTALKSQLQITSEEAAAHLEKLNLAAAELSAAKNMLSMRDAQTGLSSSKALDEEKAGRLLAEEQLTAQTALAVLAETSAKELESAMVRLRTELTIAKAELDSAHGTRAQRAAEAAADPTLQARIQTLQDELGETIADYEAMTKATIEYEKEREGLEATVDGLRDKVESLEGALAEERIAGMGVRSPGMESTRSTGVGGTSVSLLRGEFRKMMKETKEAHGQEKARLREELRGEQRRNRELETRLKGLERELAAAKRK